MSNLVVHLVQPSSQAPLRGSSCAR